MHTKKNKFQWGGGKYFRNTFSSSERIKKNKYFQDLKVHKIAFSLATVNTI